MDADECSVLGRCMVYMGKWMDTWQIGQALEDGSRWVWMEEPVLDADEIEYWDGYCLPSRRYMERRAAKGEIIERRFYRWRVEATSKRASSWSINSSKAFRGSE